jgi:hypothetical protein
MRKAVVDAGSMRADTDGTMGGKTDSEGGDTVTKEAGSCRSPTKGAEDEVGGSKESSECEGDDRDGIGLTVVTVKEWYSVS